MTETTTKEQEQQEQEKLVTITHDTETDLLIILFSQDLIIADDLFKEVAAFLRIYDQDSDYKIVISREKFIDFIRKESVYPILTKAIEELQLEFVEYAWNYILRVVDQELSPIYQSIQRLMVESKLTFEQEQQELQTLEKITETVIERKCLYEISLHTVERANEYQKQLEEAVE